MDNKRIICVVGRTCSGKDSLVSKLIDQFPLDFFPFISYTDRPMRMNETNGKEHWFLTKEEFTELKENNKALAYTEIKSEEYPDGCRYMCKEEQVDHSNLYIIDPNGIQYILENFPDIDIKIIYISTNKEIRDERAKVRSDFQTKYKQRCEQEDTQFSNFESIVDSMSNKSIIKVENNNEFNKTYIRFANAALDALESDYDPANSAELKLAFEWHFSVEKWHQK